MIPELVLAAAVYSGRDNHVHVTLPRVDALFSYQPTPGTVFFAGYSSVLRSRGVAVREVCDALDAENAEPYRSLRPQRAPRPGVYRSARALSTFQLAPTLRSVTVHAPAPAWQTAVAASPCTRGSQLSNPTGASAASAVQR